MRKKFSPLCFAGMLALVLACAKSDPVGPGQTAQITKASSPVPANAATDQAVSLQLSWKGSDPAGDTVAYNVFIDTVSPPLTKAAGGLKIPGYTASGLKANTAYYWSVTTCDCKDTVIGDIWNFTTVVNPAMARIPGGSFFMGGPLSDGYSFADESPVHSVTLSSFWMDTTLVTQNDYQGLRGINPSWFGDNPNRPVEEVTCYDAILYCNARSKRDRLDTIYAYTSVSYNSSNQCIGLSISSINYAGHGYRLPTEAEWEYACRSGSATRFYWGDSVNASFCWCDTNSGGSTQPVAQKGKNAFGLYDMIGNAWEWCNDGYAPYDSIAQTDPAGPAVDSVRVLRGGAWTSAASLLSSSVRYYHAPAFYYWDTGFRCVRR